MIESSKDGCPGRFECRQRNEVATASEYPDRHGTDKAISPTILEGVEEQNFGGPKAWRLFSEEETRNKIHAWP